MYLNRLNVRLAGAALLLLAGTPAAADPAAAPEAEAAVAPATATPAPAPVEPKKICRTLESSSSRMGAKRICMTREEWRHVKFD